uniref:Uncharacterized protein n=1 Tax=Suricata suricatta TaxID=37032 RepID=A0A673TB55_SURSU
MKGKVDVTHDFEPNYMWPLKKLELDSWGKISSTEPVLLGSTLFKGTQLRNDLEHLVGNKGNHL